MPSGGKPRLLILGGTGEARELAAALTADGDVDVTVSLAGQTTNAAGLPGRVRRGGFGGADGLVDFLRREKVDLVVDATHPFAARISAHAVDACERAGVARLALVRPDWQPRAGDAWDMVSTLGEAASVLPRHGRRAFLTTGRQGLEAFAALDEMWFLVRVAETGGAPVPLPDCRVIAARGPFDAAAERRLMQAHAIDVLVCKASGGTATSGKLAAARALGLPVVMLRRPLPPPGPAVSDAAAARCAARTALDLGPARPETPAP